MKYTLSICDMLETCAWIRSPGHFGGFMSAHQYIAVDLGGTQIRAARYSADLQMEARVALSTQARSGLDHVLARISHAIRQVWPSEGVEVAIGIGAPGPIDYRNAILRMAPNLPGWVNVPLGRLLSEQFQVPTYLGNDADLAALAEHRFGAGLGYSDLVYMTISTGIGGGLIFNNRLFTGGNGMGGEVGHMSIDANGPRCSCGNSGCLELFASGTAIARWIRERSAAGEPTLVTRLVKGDLSRITAKEVNEAAQQGDPLAIRAFETAGTYLGAAIVGLMYLVNPSLFVLGGSVTLAGDLLFGPVLRTVAERAPEAYRQTTRIVPATLGGDVGLWGALALCLMGTGLGV